MSGIGSSGLLGPRPYQTEAIKAIESAHARGLRRPAVVLPTGTGKTVVIAHLVQRRHDRPWGGQRTLCRAPQRVARAGRQQDQDVAPG
jgi:ERCC4-related helicase